MRHAILAPLLSAFVLPGLGQVINRQIVKGLHEALRILNHKDTKTQNS
jgi:hypothetical protein